MTVNNANVIDLFNDKKLVKICAPMVRYSKLQFRNLVKEYECDLCFTPMILADSFCQSEKARINEFSTNLIDSPLVVQFAASSVHDFVGAAHLVSPYCNGVDLNCGCPQRWAKTQGIGCVMLEKPELISDLVRQCRNHITKPFTISVKMRILSDLKKTISICQQLEHAGVSFLTIHGRTANQHSVGPVQTDYLRFISESVRCPVVANGGVKNLIDVIHLQEQSKCKGVMVASNLLTNPTLFTGESTTSLECVQKWLDICYNSTLNLPIVEQYHNTQPHRPPPFLVHNENLTFQCFHHHFVFMLEKLLPKSFRKIFNNFQTFDAVLEFLRDQLQIVPHVFSVEKFKTQQKIHLNYENRNSKYLNLKNTIDCKYNPDLTDGKYFNAKKICTEDDLDTCISSLFIE